MSDDNKAGKDPKTGRFLVGHSGNGGRPKGARSKLGEQFLSDLQEDWAENGKGAIRQCREEDAATYCKIVASLLPKEHIHKSEDPLDGLSDEDLEFGLSAVRAARKAAEDRAGNGAGATQARGATKPNPVH